MQSPIVIKNGHALIVGGIELVAVIDEVMRRIRIEQRGTILNGDANAVLAAKVQLIGRMTRTRPDLKVVS